MPEVTTQQQSERGHMSNITITISKVGVKAPLATSSHAGRPKGTGKIEKKIMEEIIPLLERFPNPTEEGVLLESQCKNSWLRYECKFPQLKFDFVRAEDVRTQDSRWGYDNDGVFTQLQKPKYAPRYDVYVTLRESSNGSRVSLMSACENISSFFA